MSGSFDGKVALVTGAAMGLGQAIASAFAAEGAAVGCVDVDEAALGETVEAIRGRGGRALAAVASVADGAAMERAVGSVAEEFGGLDILASNAGVVRYGEVPSISEDDWDFVIDTNLKGMYNAARFAIPEMRKRGKGAIVNTASVQAYWSHQGAVAYSSSKGGVVAFTRSLALDHAHEGIRVNAIAPGSVLTPMLRDAARRSDPDNPEAALEVFARTHPIGRLIQPEDVANVVLFLASDQAGAVTGITVPVDGGILAGNVSWDIDAEEPQS
ncbi:MAG TPA: SDR family NAD(P)-dependent oxidoreductase [Baekduia sp.]|nr:SDR family NAD(P)-dependent oxidoreductase [Baekduia sp.]